MGGASPNTKVRELPSSDELEETIIGSIILFSYVFPDIRAIIDVDSFYNYRTKILFGVLKSMFEKGSPIDLISLTQELRNANKLEEVGGAFGITCLTSVICTSDNVEYYARSLKELHLRREIILHSKKIENKAYSEDIFEVYDSSIDFLTNQLKSLKKGSHKDGKVLAKELNDELDRGEVTGKIYTGFDSIDARIGGLRPADYVILAARPSMGKTAFALNILINVCKQGKKVMLFSLEMQSVKITERLASILSGVDHKKIYNRVLNEEEKERVRNALAIIHDWDLIINDGSGLSSKDIKQEVKKNKPDIFIVDYLSYIRERGFNNNKVAEVTEISRTIKETCKETETPCIMLSQLSRSCEQRDNKRPLMSDIRDSGGIEQDADVILFLYRDDYYGIMEDENGESTKGIVEVINPKNRNGGIGVDKLLFIGEKMEFKDPNSVPDKFIIPKQKDGEVPF
jgi:replicative DNA helicase